MFDTLIAMGYRGKTAEREKARELRAEGWTMPDIAAALGVSRSSVSLWTHDVDFAARPRRRARRQKPGALELRKRAEIEAMLEQGRQWVGQLSEREFLMAGAALYAGEGDKRDGAVGMANTNSDILCFFLAWLRRFFSVDESRFRVQLYLHDGLDVDAARSFWSDLLAIPAGQFTKPYRAVPDPSIRHSKHPMGCPKVRYHSAPTHRAVMGVVAALLSSAPIPG